MSDSATRRRIRVQASAGDENVMGFILDEAVQPGRSARYEAPCEAPLARALFTLPGVTRAEVSGPTIWVRKTAAADWATLKSAIAAAIRQVLAETDAPLGSDDTVESDDPDATLLEAVEELLDRQVNPSVAAHGGNISADRVEDGNVYLRMSGGCQGCAASSATLRQGVERMLRAALPQIREIIDITDHAAGSNPFYGRDGGSTPTLHRPIPAGVIGWEDGHISVDPEFLAPRLGLTPETLREGLRNGDVVGVTETGEGADAGKTRIVLRRGGLAWAAEIDATGAAREIPPPRLIESAAGQEQDLSDRVRTHLEALVGDQTTITYGALARAVGLWMPGSVAKVTRALETTMREDAAAGRPFIAARAVSRAGDGLPGKGFFVLARALDRGPQEGESDEAFHIREITLLNEVAGQRTGRHAPAPDKNVQPPSE
ncbi:MAG: NifU family protein [Rhodobacteraceae bacterium]|nr:NifU family protein [Paracoccaceae bacterium]